MAAGARSALELQVVATANIDAAATYYQNDQLALGRRDSCGFLGVEPIEAFEDVHGTWDGCIAGSAIGVLVETEATRRTTIMSLIRQLSAELQEARNSPAASRLKSGQRTTTRGSHKINPRTRRRCPVSPYWQALRRPSS
jgi:hypothetical protein